MRAATLFLLLVLTTAGLAATLRVQLTDAKGAPVENAVAYLVRRDGPPPPLPPMKGIELVQRDQEFIPFVTVVTTGTAVTFPNRDTVQHHVYSLSPAKKFELPLYDPGKAETMVFDQPGVVTLGCNIHDWMLAYLLVLDTPWFAKSDARGTAVIAAPAGTYQLEIWHPRLKPPPGAQPVTLADDAVAPVTVSLSLKPDRRVRRAPDAKGGGY